MLMIVHHLEIEGQLPLKLKQDFLTAPSDTEAILSATIYPFGTSPSTYISDKSNNINQTQRVYL